MFATFSLLFSCEREDRIHRNYISFTVTRVQLTEVAHDFARITGFAVEQNVSDHRCSIVGTVHHLCAGTQKKHS